MSYKSNNIALIIENQPDKLLHVLNNLGLQSLDPSQSVNEMEEFIRNKLQPCICHKKDYLNCSKCGQSVYRFDAYKEDHLYKKFKKIEKQVVKDEP